MDPQVVAFLTAAFGGGGVFGMVLRRRWSKEDRSDDAYIRAREDSDMRHHAEIADLRREFSERLAEAEARHAKALGALEQHVQQLHDALAAVVRLVAPERMEEALAVLIALNPTPTTGG